jgi:hypothetical protein
MCEMLNLFVPVKRPVACRPVRGLEFVEGGEIQRDFEARFADQGAILAGAGQGPCLCGFDDWPALYEIARALLDANGVSEVAFLKFWSGDKLRLTEHVIDPDDPDQCVSVPDGVIVIARAGPAEARRHGRVVRSLTQRLGTAVTLRRKSGIDLHGVLCAFDPESEIGDVEGTFFVAAQIHAVDVAAG